MMNNTVKTGFLAAIILVASFILIPARAYAIDFNPLNPLDPFCLFSCGHREPDVQNTTYNNSNNTVDSYNTNSYNTNSGTIISNSGTGNSVYQNPEPSPTVVNNNNTNTNTNSNSNVSYPVTPVYQSTPVYSYPNYSYSYPNYSYDYDYNYPYNNNNYNYPNNYNYQNYNYNYYSPISVSCRANTSFAPVGTTVYWSAYVSGGNGYYTYTWSGTDGIYGSQSSIPVFYRGPGVKYAAVTVYSSGQQRSVQCSNTVTVGVPAPTYGYNYPVTPVYQSKPKVASKPRYTAEKTIVKEIVVKEVPAPTQTVEPVAQPPVQVPQAPIPPQAASGVLSLGNVPWGLVAILVILALLSMVFYMIFNKKKL